MCEVGSAPVNNWLVIPKLSIKATNLSSKQFRLQEWKCRFTTWLLPYIHWQTMEWERRPYVQIKYSVAKGSGKQCISQLMVRSSVMDWMRTKYLHIYSVWAFGQLTSICHNIICIIKVVLSTRFFRPLWTFLEYNNGWITSFLKERLETTWKLGKPKD